MDTTTFFLDFLFGIVGLSYLVYGKKAQHPSALISGFALSIFPFFVSNLWITLLLGVVFTAAPFLIEI